MKKKHLIITVSAIVGVILCVVFILLAFMFLGKKPEHVHDFGEWTSDNTATHTRTCKDCNETETENHVWDSGKTLTERDCTTDQEIIYTCTVCKAVDTVYSTAKGHSYGEWIAEVPAECEKTGTKGHYHCDDCGKNFDSDKQEISSITIPAKGHSYGEWIAEVPAECETAGTKGHYHCDDCGKNFDFDKQEIDAINISAKGHVWGAWTSNGDSHTRQCDNCTETQTESHTWDTGTITTQGDCTTDKVTTFTCTECGTTKTEMETAIGHVWGSWTSNNNTTHTRECSNCDETQTEDHNFVNDICSDCGKEKYTVGLKYTDKGDYYEVSGIGTVTDTDIIVPDIYNNKPVKSIGEGAFRDCSSLTSIEIPNSVTSIGDETFYGCSSLTSIDIPDSVTSIGSYAFGSCSGLTSIDIPDSVTSIRNGAFWSCSSLTSIEIPSSVTYIGKAAFRRCYELTMVCWNATACKLDSDVYSAPIFYQCSKITTVIVGESVTSIPHYAFMECDNLANVTIPESVTNIEHGAFIGCYKLIVDGVMYADNWAVGCDTSVTSVMLRSNTVGIAEHTFSSDNLTSVTIPNGITHIGSPAFYYCSNLETVYWNSTACTPHMFEQCDRLTTVIIGDNVTSIQTSAFYGCSSLTSIDIPDSVTSIGSYAFGSCRSLTSIEIPNSVTSIGSYAFRSCSGLTSITFDGTMEQWKAISLDSFWSDVSSITTIHCLDGDITIK